MRLPGPRALLGASAVLFAVFVVGVLVTRRHLAPPAPVPVPVPVPAPKPAPAVTVRAAAFAATVSWTGDPTARVAWGPARLVPLLSARSERGSLRLTALAPNTRYRVSVAGRGAVTFRTRPIAPNVRASTADGTLRVDGSPIFPLITWQECPNRWAPELRDGISLFGGNPCTGLQNLVTAVRSRALVAGTENDTPGVAGPVGWFLADEADAHGYSAATLPPPGGAGIGFLTLTSHFFALAAPLPAGRAMYPGLIRRANMVGFDLYPLQELCRPDLLPWVFDAQVALRRLAGGRPTFQWIEDREMKCPETPVTPRTIRVESWLAIAGGAVGLAYFPNQWTPAAGAAIRGIARDVRRLAPALLTPPLPVAIAPQLPAVRASAREYGGARYVIAINAGPTAVHVRLDGTPATLAPLSVRLFRRP